MIWWQPYGGLDVLINTAALFPSSTDGNISDEQWGVTLDINVTANYLLADEAARILTRPESRRIHRADQFRQCRCAKAGQRSLRRQQGSAQSSGTRTGDFAVPEDSCKRHQSRYRDQGIDHVSPRSRDHGIAEEISDSPTRKRPAMSSCGLCSPSSTPNARSLIARSIRKIARKQFCSWRDRNHLALPATLFRWMVG